MNRIDLSKLPAPQLVEELDYETILTDMRGKMRDICPEWTGYELESDPANKILEVAAYREMLLRQRMNEAVRGVMIAFATGADLDHLAAFYPETRLPGAAATFRAVVRLSAPLDVQVTIPEGYTVVSQNGEVEARLTHVLTILPGNLSSIGTGLFEIVKPLGSLANGLQLHWEAITPLPFVVKIEQLDASHGGSDVESDDDFRRRIPLALEKYATGGPRGAYEALALEAEERVKDVCVTSPTPGEVKVYLLSKEGDGTADEAMIARVHAVLNAETVRPLTDHVETLSASIVRYEVKMNVVLYAGVAGDEPFMEAKRRVAARVSELHGVGVDVTRSALIAAAHVPGVKEVELLKPAADIRIADSQAAYCTKVEVGNRVAEEP